MIHPMLDTCTAVYNAHFEGECPYRTECGRHDIITCKTNGHMLRMMQIASWHMISCIGKESVSEDGVDSTPKLVKPTLFFVCPYDPENTIKFGSS